MKKIAILTSGGDAPGMNTAIRAVVKMAEVHGIEVFLVYEGYKGLHQGNIVPAKGLEINRHLSSAGTFIYSSRYPEFKNPEVRLEAKAQLDKLGIEALVVIGGDGSYMGAQLLHEIGVKTIALPGTIDNDIASSDYTIGYNTALETVTESVKKIRDTMRSHGRTAIVEVMGHGCGDLALFSGIATGAEIIITNEAKKSVDEIVTIVKDQKAKGKRSVIILVSEFLFDSIEDIAKELQEKTGVVTKAIKLAHVQRGGRPSVNERILATRMGIKAVELLKDDQSGLAIGEIKQEMVSTPIKDALKIKSKNRVSLTEKINSLNQK